MADPFRSARLIYRAAEPTSEEDQALFLAIQTDAIGYRNAEAAITKPQGKASAEKYLNDVAKDSLLGVVICLDTPARPIPIGVIHLDLLKPALAHHRHTDIGIDIVKAYRGQGYGSEAIRWALRWAFRTAGLHRVSIGAFAYNEGAVKLYKRLGFKEEGVKREFVWSDGRWWDDVQFSMLAQEWERLSRNDEPRSSDSLGA